MNRSFICIFLALAMVPATAFADDPTPTKEQLDAAKKAFGEGKQLHDQGKLGEAIDKFKESYRLSRNPVLLYNIALSLDENKQTDNALFYYRKFLSDAPADAAQRKAADERVKAIEKEKLEADLNGKSTDTSPTPPTKPEAKPDEPKAPIKIKPAGTYSANDFQHQIVDVAPPGKPLDITAFVPEDSGFTVTMFYRGSGDSKFNAKAMKWRYKELVARVPAAKMAGSSIQYYLEVKDQQGNVVTRAGKSTSPNLIGLEAGASPRFYPDLNDDGDARPVEETRRHDDDDPLGGNKHEVDTKGPVDTGHVDQPTAPGQGFMDVGSEKFRYAKWGSTYTAAGLIGLGVAFYWMAHNQASAIANDANDCPMGGMPPCRMFDSYDKDVQDAGKRDQTISNVGLGFGLVAAAVAGYFWYREMSAKKHGELKAASRPASSPEMTWAVTPTLGNDTTGVSAGAAAAVRF